MISDAERERLRAAWGGHCDALKSIGDEALDGKIGDPRDGDELAELLRSIARMSTMAVMHRLDFNDPDFPVFMRQMDDRFRYGGPDPNISYFLVSLDGAATYRVRGSNFGRAFTIGTLSHDSVRTNEKDEFEVFISADELPGNWTPIARDFQGDIHIPDQYPMPGQGLSVRIYNWEWGQDAPPGWLSIERMDADAPAYPDPLTADRLADQIENATRLFVAAARWWNRRAQKIRADMLPNVLSKPGTTPPGVTSYTPTLDEAKPWLYYGVMCIDLKEDEAIVVESDLPDGPYWSFTLYNMWWETPDFLNRQTSLNAEQTYVDPDGKARFVISSQDPGTPNWLDTGGPRRAFLFYRWARPDQKIPIPFAQITKIHQVREFLPAEHPSLDRAARTTILANRRRQFAKRFQR